MRKLVVWGTVLSGVAAAYLMYKRGERPLTIARKATLQPIGTLLRELKT